MCVNAGTPLAPPPSDATKPKIPSGPDLRVPETPSPSLGITPQLANGPPPSPAKAADKVAKKVNWTSVRCFINAGIHHIHSMYSGINSQACEHGIQQQQTYSVT